MYADARPFLQQFRLVDPDWYETLNRYRPSDELLRVVRAVTPATWQIRRNDIWYHLSPVGSERPRQGWKIHVSAIPTNCEDVLRNAAAICIQREAPFKFALDRRLVFLSTYKGWSRGASGKFITIYPHDEQHFRELLEALYTALQSFAGPYVLSDRRYRDARTLYYRYGGIDGFRVLSFSGDQQYMLVAPNGDLVPDLRLPYWNPPPWASDPFGPTEDEDLDPVLKDGRYKIERALGFSVTGGVYVATDFDTGTSVVIKEARPITAIDENGDDAVDRLRKEYRLLQRLQDTGITPAPVDLFWDWEHLFLVEEYISGLDLGHFTIGFNPLIKIDHDERAMEAYVEKLRTIWTNLALGVAAMHDRGIACGDLSIKNVIVRDLEPESVRIVDLEAAWEEGIDAPSQLTTPGFASPTQRGTRGKEDDFYALGAVMLGTLFPMNSLLDVEPFAKDAFAEAAGADLGLPDRVRQVILGCMSDDAAMRPMPRQVAEALQLPHITIGGKAAPHNPLSSGALATMIGGVGDYIRTSADPHREDRLFPADPLVFATNPLSVAYGAVGVAYALSKIEGEVPSPIRAWILARPAYPDRYPPGLYLGSSGIAWALWELGLEEVALQTLRAADSHPLLWDATDVLFGGAGYGLACLRFYLGTTDQMWLDRAVQIGERLLHSKMEDADRGCYWPDKEGNVWLGYARGSSGIALYLLYLSLATGEKRFMAAGERALAFDLAHAQENGEGRLSIPRGTVGALENVLTHYWVDGSAGVGTALVRFWACTKAANYRDSLERLAADSFRKYTAFPGLFRGLSGLGNFLLDAYEFTGEERYLHEAQRAASGVSLFAIQRPAGIAFPGEQLLRISTDFGTGSAGVALFLHRLAHTDQRIGNFNFTLDQLLQENTVGDRR